MAFRIGQKVVCVKGFADVARLYPFLNFPEEGATYTVSSIDAVYNGLRFKEVTNPPFDVGLGPQIASFYPGRFRPVVERKTDISVFKAMLNSSDERVSA